MAQSALLSAFSLLKAAHSDAVTPVVVVMSATEEVTADGLKGNKTIARAIVKGGLADNADISVWVPTSMFTDAGHTLDKVRGKVARIGPEGSEITQRILATVEHPLGGLVKLILGEYDRVTQ